MRSTSRFLAPIPLSLVAIAVLASASVAAPRTLALTDPVGDAIDGRRDMDIVGLTFAPAAPAFSTPRVSVSMRLAAPSAPAAASYIVGGRVGCGYLAVSYSPGRVATALVGGPFELWTSGCGHRTRATSVEGAVEGTTIRWFVPLTSLPQSLVDAGHLTEISATTGTADPVTGFEGNAQVEGMRLAPTDEITSSKEWKFA